MREVKGEAQPAAWARREGRPLSLKVRQRKAQEVKKKGAAERWKKREEETDESIARDAALEATYVTSVAAALKATAAGSDWPRASALALSALAQRGDKSAGAALAKLLESPKEEVREIAVNAFGSKYDTPEAFLNYVGRKGVGWPAGQELARNTWCILRGRGSDPLRTWARGSRNVVAGSPLPYEPSSTALLRKQAGRRADAQVLAANVDVVFVVSAMNAEFNERRLERFLAMVLDAGARPVSVLNKADLHDDTTRFVDAVRGIAPTAPVVTTSAVRGDGLEALRAHVADGETIALVGSSGVGKSALTNCLLGRDVQREGAARGR